MLVRARSRSMGSCSSGLVPASRLPARRLVMAQTIVAVEQKMFATSCSERPYSGKILDMDAIDREILALLQADGRITLTDLADTVRLSVSRCQRRVRELERTGVILGYQAKVDPASLGLGFEVLVFATLSRPEMVGDFDQAIAAIPQVIEAQRLFSEPDYILRVVTARLRPLPTRAR